jgi:predicted SnoaL-like aldol condensation-catalyzing enzyme
MAFANDGANMNLFNRFSRAAGTVGAAALAATMSIGSAQAATYTSQEQANMKLVSDFYAALDRGDAAGDIKQRIRSIAEQYLRPDYIQHMEAQQSYGTGREGFIKMFEQMSARPGAPGAMGPPPPAKVIALVASGDLVIRISSRSMPGAADSSTFIFNMFRVQEGKLAEHWDGYSGTAMMPGKGGPGSPPGIPPGAMPPSTPPH